MRLLILALILISSVATAQETEAALRLLGRLEPRKLAKDVPPQFWIQVGPTRYALELDAATTALAKKLRDKFVVMEVERKDDEAVVVRPHGKQPLAAQERIKLVGYVRAAPKTQRKQVPYLLATTQGNYRVTARDKGKFRKLVDGYVTVQAHVTSDGSYRQVEAVKSVDRTLAPGARGRASSRPRNAPSASSWSTRSDRAATRCASTASSATTSNNSAANGRAASWARERSNWTGSASPRG